MAIRNQNGTYSVFNWCNRNSVIGSRFLYENLHNNQGHVWMHDSSNRSMDLNFKEKFTKPRVNEKVKLLSTYIIKIKRREPLIAINKMKTLTIDYLTQAARAIRKSVKPTN